MEDTLQKLRRGADISDRAAASAAEKVREELWRASVRRYRSKRAQEIRDAWVAYYLRLAGVHQHLSEENRRRAARLASERRG